MTGQITTSLDVMGGDAGPELVIPGADIALTRRPDLRFRLFGDEAKVRPLLDRFPRVRDAAVFEQMSSNGTEGSSGQALSVGVGARVIPTWLASIVGRVDLARLLAPDHLWFVQYGLSQYF